MKQKLFSLSALILSVSVLLSGCTVSGPESPGGLGTGRTGIDPVADPYMRQDFLVLQSERRLELSNNMKKISVTADEASGGVRFTGPAAHPCK